MKLKFLVGLSVLIILGFTIFGDNGLVNLVRSKERTEALAQEARRLEAENQRLLEEIERLKHDDAYLERVAREKLGMVKPGELVFQFTDESGPGKP